MNVDFSPAAFSALDAIWTWNAHRYDNVHADQYIAFLAEHAEQLGSGRLHGRPVPGRAGTHYLVVRRRSRGHGHVLVYVFRPGLLEVLNVYHTSQDWMNQLL